jgi:hypothetical protein
LPGGEHAARHRGEHRGHEEREELVGEHRHAHVAGGNLVLPDGQPRPADLGATEVRERPESEQGEPPDE